MHRRFYFLDDRKYAAAVNATKPAAARIPSRPDANPGQITKI